MTGLKYLEAMFSARRSNAHAQTLIGDAFVLDEGRHCVYRKDNPLFSGGSKANWRAPVYLVCGDTLADVIGGLKTRRGAGRVKTWEGIHHTDGGYSTEVNLAPGLSLENTWDSMQDAWYWADHNVAPAHPIPSSRIYSRHEHQLC